MKPFSLHDTYILPKQNIKALVSGFRRGDENSPQMIKQMDQLTTLGFSSNLRTMGHITTSVLNNLLFFAGVQAENIVEAGEKQDLSLIDAKKLNLAGDMIVRPLFIENRKPVSINTITQQYPLDADHFSAKSLNQKDAPKNQLFYIVRSNGLSKTAYNQEHGVGLNVSIHEEPHSNEHAKVTVESMARGNVFSKMAQDYIHLTHQLFQLASTVAEAMNTSRQPNKVRGVTLNLESFLTQENAAEFSKPQEPPPKYYF
jgi:hypothetical protein